MQAGGSCATTLETVLRGLGERKDIIRTMQRTFGADQREFAIPEEQDSGPITGRIAAKGLSGEAHDKPYSSSMGSTAARTTCRFRRRRARDLPVGGIVEVRRPRDSIADRNIAAIAENGLYVRSPLIAELRRTGMRSARAEEIVDGHVRRLEALRREKIVERVADGLWRVPSDLLTGQGLRSTRLEASSSSFTLTYPSRSRCARWA